MATVAENNKRIAKNTAILYGRMIIVMLISIYSSRVILKVLGVEDYGTYNVVGGFVALLSSLNGSMRAATYRFIAIELGKGSPIEQIRTYFNSSLMLHVAIGLIVVLLSETIGLWWIYSHLNVAPDRLPSSMLAYHLFVLQSFFVITNSPYQSLYDVHERFDIGAALGLFEVLARFGAVLVLDYFSGDKLEIYALLLFGVALFMTILRKVIAHRLFPESHFKLAKDKVIYKELLGFSSLTLVPNIIDAVTREGTNLLLNSFFGPVANAAKGISLQIEGAIWSFIGNVQAPAGPAIMKYYGEGEYGEMKKLTYRLAKFSLYIFFILALPVAFEVHNILQIWLTEVPEYSVSFVLLALFASLLNAFMTPVGTIINATGQIKRVAFWGALIQPVNFVLIYIVYKLGGEPASQIAVGIITSCLFLYLRLLEVKRLFGYAPYEYVRYAFVDALPALMSSALLPAVVVYYVEPTIWRLFINAFFTVLFSVGCIYTLGLDTAEKEFVQQFVIKLRSKYFRKKTLSGSL